jgi:hypothetical protein
MSVCVYVCLCVSMCACICPCVFMCAVHTGTLTLLCHAALCKVKLAVPSVHKCLAIHNTHRNAAVPQLAKHCLYHTTNYPAHVHYTQMLSQHHVHALRSIWERFSVVLQINHNNDQFVSMQGMVSPLNSLESRISGWLLVLAIFYQCQ